MKGNRTDLDSLAQIRIILVEPKEPGNVGAVARAMKNMGLNKLYLVHPSDFASGEARKMATGSGDVLYGATVSDSLEEALAGTVLSVATTHRKRQHFECPSSPEAVARRLVSLPPGNEGAVVFGREDRGLTTDEIHRCNVVARIPTARPYPSLNLAQAALIFAYELSRAAASDAEAEPRDLAPFEAVESFYAHVASVLEKLGFVSPHRLQTFMHAIRRTFGRVALENRDVATLHKLFRQVDKFAARYGVNDGQDDDPVAGIKKKWTP